MDATTESRVNRSRLRFSVRSALAIITLLCMAFGIWSARAHQQRQAVTKLERAGLFVSYTGDEMYRYTHHSANLAAREARRNSFLVHYLESATRVEFWRIDPAPAPAELRPVADLPYIEGIVLWGSGITDEHLETIASNPAIQSVRVHSDELTDRGVSSLEKLRDLRTLDLAGCEGVTDHGLERIAELDRLAYLDLSNTSVTAKGVRDFAHAHPRCDVISDFPASK